MSSGHRLLLFAGSVGNTPRPIAQMLHEKPKGLNGSIILAQRMRDSRRTLQFGRQRSRAAVMVVTSWDPSRVSGRNKQKPNL